MTIFVDLRKAFDSVDLEVLLSRMSVLGICSTLLEWFMSYLYGRSMKVVAGDLSSKLFPLVCGVPQGSVLGPLLFLIYVETLRFYLSEADLTTFADDTALTITAKSLEEQGEKANKTVTQLLTFTSASFLSVNKSKTNYLIFGRTGRIVNNTFKLTFDVSEVIQVFDCKYLGCHLDVNFNFKRHCEILSSKIARSAGILRRLKHFLPLNALKNIIL